MHYEPWSRLNERCMNCNAMPLDHVNGECRPEPDDDDAQIAERRITTGEGLKLLGWNLMKAQRGSVMIYSPHNLGRRFKHYAARYRVGDGHLLYRWGRLTGATATYINGKFSHVYFTHHPE